MLTNYCEKYKSCKLEAIKIKNKAFAVLQKTKKQNSFIQNSLTSPSGCWQTANQQQDEWNKAEKASGFPARVAADLWHNKGNVVEKLL